ncbi:Uncharacterized protein FKW44_010799 [Caligus rogercresseyi]|uniref:DUF7041 domain-containing protein n=1 Tax=Caligus rogercresseyi TaxID=217165 RepID=A0A7T8K7M7_CALRO|nr:Uncharacterized protein FKW44_010799 [Caligus rogercresseyi]
MTSSWNDTIQALACKAPPFFAECPEVWSMQIESIFESSRITDQITKFNKVLESLDRDIYGLRTSDYSPARRNRTTE